MKDDEIYDMWVDTPEQPAMRDEVILFARQIERKTFERVLNVCKESVLFFMMQAQEGDRTGASDYKSMGVDIVIADIRDLMEQSK